MGNTEGNNPPLAGGAPCQISGAPPDLAAFDHRLKVCPELGVGGLLRQTIVKGYHQLAERLREMRGNFFILKEKYGPTSSKKGDLESPWSGQHNAIGIGQIRNSGMEKKGESLT